MSDPVPPLSFFARVAMAFVFFFRILYRAGFAEQVLPAYKEPARLPAATEPAAEVPVEAPPPEKVHASGLFVLAMLQREGRLIDFLQEDIAAYGDAEIGAAARVVHEGCRKVMRQYLSLEPVVAEAEGASVMVPNGFDANRFRLTGNVAGQPPYRGALRHHGWVATGVKFPNVSEALDPRVIAPAEVELA